MARGPPASGGCPGGEAADERPPPTRPVGRLDHPFSAGHRVRLGHHLGRRQGTPALTEAQLPDAGGGIVPGGGWSRTEPFAERHCACSEGTRVCSGTRLLSERV